MTNWTKCPAVERTPGKISGAWAFTGTRGYPCTLSSKIWRAAPL